MDVFRYRAFLSYSHTDKKWADWLHRALETYRVPYRLVGRDSRDGKIPARILPIFRDREELPGSADLGSSTNQALHESHYLIVICSPRSAQSRWVGEAITTYKKLGREDHILGLIVDGEPNAGDGNASFEREQECFHEAMRYQLAADGTLSSLRVEPIAADVREGKGGKNKAELQLLAGLLGVNYDDISPRQDERLLRRVTRWMRGLVRRKSVVRKPALTIAEDTPQGTLEFIALDRISIKDAEIDRTISLWQGDLSRIPRKHYVDMLIVSAFGGIYEPVPGTLMGALEERGLSVNALSKNKGFDLLDNCGFWISKPLHPGHDNLNIGRLVCFESGHMRDPPEVVGHLFRGLFPFLDLASDHIVALPLLATGQQQWNKHVMLNALVGAAAEWMRRGLPLKELRIVLSKQENPDELQNAFARIRNKLSNQARLPLQPTPRQFDVFISYSSKDVTVKNMLMTEMRKVGKHLNIFDFKNEIDLGQSYQSEIDRSIENARMVACILSPNYFASSECMEELHMARLRNKRGAVRVLLPFYWQSCVGDLALWLQTLNFYDAREMRAEAVTDFARSVCECL
jgi:TIR domain/MTH538 TIR-like domain (DUF1863)